MAPPDSCYLRSMPFRPWRIAVILGTGTALGLLWNGFSGRGFALDQSVFVQAGDEVILAAEAKSRLDKGALFLDARPVDFYNMAHIPGALPLPEPEFDAYFARLEKQLRSTYNIVIYCAGYGCEASHIVAQKLRERGIHGAILHEGWPAWTDAGYATKTGTEP
jgi:rhodanese-related sulfurtransferase